MRLTEDQIQIIRTAVQEVFGNDAEVILFGSRADDDKRGGDIDLLVCPGADAVEHPFHKRIDLLTKLERDLGERKIDIIIEHPDHPREIESIARRTGIRL